MLARLAFRIAAIEALKDNTFVAGNVLDSQIDALDVSADAALRTDQDKPFVAVYVDESRIDERLELRALHRSGNTDLTIESGIATNMVETDPETGVSQIVGVGVPATDKAMEFYLDCVDRQIINALTDPNNEWAEIWRGLSSVVSKIVRKRTSDATGTRIAAHQTVISADLLADPVFGEAVASTSIWARLFAKMEEAEHPYLAAMQALIGSPDGVLDSEAQRRRFGMTLDEARALTDIAVQPGEPTEPNLEIVTSVGGGNE